MSKSEAIAFYGGNISALARALGIHQSTVYSWGQRPPIGRQYQLQEITGGLLRADKPSDADQQRKVEA
jgi:transposase-like protein